MSARPVLLIILVIDVIAIILALALGETPGQYFEEAGFITHLSFIQLLVIAWLSWKIFGMRRIKSLIWLIIALAFFYLALDEILMLHEKMDLLIHWAFKIRETAITDRIDDIIIGCYALVALTVLYFHREEFKKYKKSFPLFTGAGFLAFSMVAMDILTNRDDIIRILISNPALAEKIWLWLSAAEDALKIITEGVLIGAFYFCLEIARDARYN